MKKWMNKRRREYFLKASMKADQFYFIYFIGAVLTLPFFIGLLVTQLGIAPSLIPIEASHLDKWLSSMAVIAFLYFYSNEFSVALHTKKVIYCYDEEGTPHLKRSIYRVLLGVHIASIFITPCLISLLPE